MSGRIRLVRPSGKPAYWEIQGDAHVMMMLRRVFPNVSAAPRNAVHMLATEETCRNLIWFNSRFSLDVAEADRFYLKAKADAHKQREIAVADLLAGKTVPRTFDLAMPPRDYQRLATEMAYNLKALLLGDQVGLGKTVVYIALISLAETRPALWVTQTHLRLQAEREIKRFCPGLKVVSPTRTSPHPLGFERAGQAPDVVLLNYQKWAGWAEYLRPHIRTLICDEAQELRHDNSLKYKAARYQREGVTWALLGTGTPIYNYGGEIFNVMEIAKPGALGSWDEFVTAWAQERDAKGRAVVHQPQALGTHLRQEGLFLRRTRQDVGRELAMLSRIVVPIDTDPTVIKQAQSGVAELARLILAESGDGFRKLQASNEIDRVMRQATGVAKAPYVAELVKMILDGEEGGRKDRVVVFAWHHAVYNILEDALRAYGVARYTGEQNATQKDNALKRFMARSGDGRARVLLLSLRAGAGIDGLQHVCRTGVFAELDWSPKVHEQCEGRLCRDQQTDTTDFYYPVAETGSDPVVMDILQIKTGQADGITDPDGAVFGQQTDPDKIRRLARMVLNQNQ